MVRNPSQICWGEAFFKYIYCVFSIHFNWYVFLLLFLLVLRWCLLVGSSMFTSLLLMVFATNPFVLVSFSPWDICNLVLFYIYIVIWYHPLSSKPVDSNMKHGLYGSFILFLPFALYLLFSIFLVFIHGVNGLCLFN